ncbi:MAG: hypothetical protein AB1512_21450 [Thermodesulfobacteriota bacterium]
MDRETLMSLAKVVGFALIFLAWGGLIFFMVGDKGQPPWNFGVVKDVPGSSRYSTHAPASAAKPGAVEEKVEVQHVEGRQEHDRPGR